MTSFVQNIHHGLAALVLITVVSSTCCIFEIIDTNTLLSIFSLTILGWCSIMLHQTMAYAKEVWDSIDTSPKNCQRPSLRIDTTAALVGYRSDGVKTPTTPTSPISPATAERQSSILENEIKIIHVEQEILKLGLKPLETSRNRILFMTVFFIVLVVIAVTLFDTRAAISASVAIGFTILVVGSEKYHQKEKESMDIWRKVRAYDDLELQIRRHITHIIYQTYSI
ncbi:hypothetical protein GQ42DRAFT_24519 [Ramicandelaber brevisporus]|nr:hypothetical protein GQ42DRAFT_24519 [Ramicandelaber brevisporus]